MKKLFVVTRTRGNAWNLAKPMRAQAGWQEHALFMDDLSNAGFVVLGGPLGEGEKTLLIVDAADENEIRQTFARDPWSKSSILDVRSIQLWTVLLQAAGPKLRVMPPPEENLESDARA
ncbi:MAG: YciI family protein [Verrucomicrobiota bacterium]